MEAIESDTFVLAVSKGFNIKRVSGIYPDCEEIIHNVYAIFVGKKVRAVDVTENVRDSQDSYHPFVLVAGFEGGISFPPNG